MEIHDLHLPSVRFIFPLIYPRKIMLRSPSSWTWVMTTQHIPANTQSKRCQAGFEKHTNHSESRHFKKILFAVILSVLHFMFFQHTPGSWLWCAFFWLNSQVARLLARCCTQKITSLRYTWFFLRVCLGNDTPSISILNDCARAQYMLHVCWIGNCNLVWETSQIWQ